MSYTRSSPQGSSYGFVASSLSSPETPSPISMPKTSSEIVTELENTEDPTRIFRSLRAQLLNSASEAKVNSFLSNREILENIKSDLKDIPMSSRIRQLFLLCLNSYISEIAQKTRDELKYRTGQYKEGECPLDKLPCLTESFLCLIYIIRHPNGQYNNKVTDIFEELVSTISDEDEWGKKIRLAGKELLEQTCLAFKISTNNSAQDTSGIIVNRSAPIPIIPSRPLTPCIR